MKRFSNSNKLILTELTNYINGLMLSDGHILKRRYKGSYSQVCKFREWIEEIGSVFDKHGVANILTDVLRPDRLCGKYKVLSRMEYHLRTLEYDELGVLHDRWYILEDDGIYSNGRYWKKYIKLIPKDLKLTSECVANWYIGDGSIYYTSYNGTRFLYLSTNGFIRTDIDFLCDLLNVTLDINSVIHKGGQIYIHRKRDISCFLDYINAYNINCYSYKFPNKSVQYPRKVLQRMWTEAEIKELYKNYDLYYDYRGEAEEVFGRSWIAIEAKLRSLGLNKQRKKS